VNGVSQSFSLLSKAFGYHVLLIFLDSLLEIILFAYVLISHFQNHAGDSRGQLLLLLSPAFILHVASMGAYVYRLSRLIGMWERNVH